MDRFFIFNKGKRDDPAMKIRDLTKGASRLESAGLWTRCFEKKGVFLFLSLVLTTGILAGPILAAAFDLFGKTAVLPLLFSGIPAAGSGIFSRISTLLLNQLIFLTVDFLLGITAFGAFAVPLFVFFRGMAVGLGVSSFLWVDGLSGLGRSALSYAPASAASLLIFLLFSLRAMLFADRLRKAGFSLSEKPLNFWDYWKEYLEFLIFAVVISMCGGALSALEIVFFHS